MATNVEMRETLIRKANTVVYQDGFFWQYCRVKVRDDGHPLFIRIERSPSLIKAGYVCLARGAVYAVSEQDLLRCRIQRSNKLTKTEQEAIGFNDITDAREAVARYNRAVGPEVIDMEREEADLLISQQIETLYGNEDT